MKLKTKLDEYIDVEGDTYSEAQCVAAAQMADLLQLCWLAAKSVFGGKAKPEHATALLPSLIAMSEAQAAKRPAAPAQDAVLTSGSTSP